MNGNISETALKDTALRYEPETDRYYWPRAGGKREYVEPYVPRDGAQCTGARFRADLEALIDRKIAEAFAERDADS